VNIGGLDLVFGLLDLHGAQEVERSLTLRKTNSVLRDDVDFKHVIVGLFVLSRREHDVKLTKE